MKKVKKSKLNSSLYNGKFSLLIENNIKDCRQFQSYKKIEEELKKREPYIDFEAEVLPYLNKKREYIFKNYIIKPRGKTQEEIAAEVGLTISGVCRSINFIFIFIDELINKKKKISEFVESFGGYDSLEDLALCLTEKDQIVLREVALSIDPNSKTKLFEKYSIKINGEPYRVLEKNINKIVERKNKCENFIKNNGGEDFLINEFGMTLPEDQFNILLMFIMDYHYTNIHEASKSIGGAQNYLLVTIKLILNKLEDYKHKKIEVEKILEDAGGEERVYKELYSKLNEKQKIIFEQRFLAYHNVSKKEIAKEINEKQYYVHYECGKIKKYLEELKISFQK